MITEQLVVIVVLLTIVLANQIFIISKLRKMPGTLADIQAQNQALIDAITAEDTVIGGAITLINGFATTLNDIKTQLAAAIASSDPVAIQAVADSLTNTAADVKSKSDALAAAVAANTPAAPGA